MRKIYLTKFILETFVHIDIKSFSHNFELDISRYYLNIFFFLLLICMMTLAFQKIFI